MTSVNKYNLANSISLIILLGIFIWLVYYGFYQFYPFKILEYEKVDQNGVAQYEILDNEVVQGGLLYYRPKFEKFTNDAGRLNCNFKDGLLYRVPEIYSNLPKGTVDYVQSIPIPVGLPAGRYEYECLVTYELRTGRIIEYRFETDTFTVIEKNED